MRASKRPVALAIPDIILHKIIAIVLRKTRILIKARINQSPVVLEARCQREFDGSIICSQRMEDVRLLPRLYYFADCRTTKNNFVTKKEGIILINEM